MSEPLFIVVDLFCGFGGTTKGFVMAKLKEIGIAKVIACINHDPKAIKSHWLNNPDVKHFEEDIRTLDLTELVNLVKYYRKLYPHAKLILWASLECTNFSKAKGGQPREADSRTLAESLHSRWDGRKYVEGDSYIQLLQPDYIEIENVVEFMSWGPLDQNGKPVSRKNGEDWMHWRKTLCKLGYIDEWRELNSANYGAYTSRNRLFGIFAKPWLPIVWPEPTHTKNPGNYDMFSPLQKWKAVKEVLHFEDEGESIFIRKKPLSDKTLQRIYAGLVKFVAKGDTAFLSKYFSGSPEDKNISVDRPADTITTIDHHSLITSSFIVQRNSGKPESKIVDIEGPARTVTNTGGNQDLVQASFLLQTYAADSQGHNTFSVDKPARTITTRDSTQLVKPEFLAHYYGNGFCTPTNEPCPTVTTKDRAALVQCEPFIMPTNFDNSPKSIEEPLGTITADRHHCYIVNPSHGGHVTSADAPCPVIVARQDKAPLYLVQCSTGQLQIEIYGDDSPTMVKIKQFMVAYRIVDIKMRMLRVKELLKIQGFPPDTQMVGNQADHKKFIGNSVVPQVVKAMTEALGLKFIETEQKQVA